MQPSRHTSMGAEKAARWAKETLKTVHPEYQRFFRTRMLRKSPYYQKQFVSVLSRLPPPEDLTQEWVLDFIERPSERDGRPLANDTVRQYLVKIEMVAEFLGKPEIVEGIPKPPQRLLTHEDILQEHETRPLIQNAPDSQTRALIHLLAETGLRIDEALSIKVENIHVAKTRHRVIDVLKEKVRVSGRMWRIDISRSKSMVRPIWPYHSTPSLLAWLVDHPVKKGPLFVSQNRRKRVGGILSHEELTYAGAYKMITQAYVNTGYRDQDELRTLKRMLRFIKLLETTGENEVETTSRYDRIVLRQVIETRVTAKQVEEAIELQMTKPPIPRRRIHILRHGVGTKLERKGVPTKKKNRMMGWSDKSMAGHRYTHLVEDDIEEEWSRIHGLEEAPKETRPGIESWMCPVCHTLNPPSSGVCLSCPPGPEPEPDRIEQLEEQVTILTKAIDTVLGEKVREMGIMPSSEEEDSASDEE